MLGLRLKSSGGRLLWLAALAVAASISASAASAQSYPNHVIRIIHGFAPGGAADTLSRIMAEGLSKQLGQNVIVEAKPGAGGNIGSEAVAKARVTRVLMKGAAVTAAVCAMNWRRVVITESSPLSMREGVGNVVVHGIAEGLV